MTEDLAARSDPEKVLKAALAGGGEFADLFYERRRTTALSLEDGKLEDIVRGAEVGVGLRLVRGGREIYAYANDAGEASLMELARTVASVEPGGAAPGPFDLTERKAPSPNLIREDPAGVPLEKKADLLLRIDKAARGQSPKIRQVKAVYRDLAQEILVVSSLGHTARDSRKNIVLLAHVVAAEEGRIQTGYEPMGGALGFEVFEEESPEELARVAVDRALLMLQAPRARGGTMPAVLSSEAGGTMIHEAVGHGLEADLAQEGLSVYSARLGQPIASPLVTVTDDATLPGKRGSFAFDDEGTPAEKTVLVEKGVLKTYMYSLLTARKFGGRPTGNGRRESYKRLPIVRMTNTCILPGETDPVSIVKSVERGIFVRKMGGGQVNTVTGDFVFEVSEGYVIEKGEVGHAVRGATLAGNGPKVLGEIDMVGSDLGYGIGTCGKEGQGAPIADAQPTLRIPEIVVGGEV